MGKKPEICVYAICRNEEKFIDRWYNTVKEADSIIVVDTGSEDNTVDLLRSYGVIVHEQKIIPWSFSEARNLSLSYVPQSTDICVCSDLDNLFIKGWRKLLEESWELCVNKQHLNVQWRYRHIVYNKSIEIPDLEFYDCRIHTRKNFKWIYPIHEMLDFTGEQKYQVILDTLQVIHMPDNLKSRSAYVTMLENALSQQPSDPRMNYFYGIHYSIRKDWENTIKRLKYYLQLVSEDSEAIEEMATAMRKIAISYYNLGMLNDSFYWFEKALSIQSKARINYIEYAKILSKEKMWLVAKGILERAISIEREEVGIRYNCCWDSTVFILLIDSCINLGLHDTAEGYIDLALSLHNSDRTLILLKEKMERRKDDTKAISIKTSFID